MKRFLSLLLTIVMCISMSSVAFAADSTDMMSDVEKAKPININGNVANPCTIGGTETWYDIDYSDWFTFSGNNLTPVGNDGGSYLYALDVSNGSSANYANLQIYEYNASDAQKFCLAKTSYGGAWVIFTKSSNYEKAVVLNGPTCDQGRNVDQYTFQNRVNEVWILEPAARNDDYGVEYAKLAYDKHIAAYPDLDSFHGGADCANFVSQCMLTSGMHFYDDWYVYRKNQNYSVPTTVEELDNSWELADPSPWISAAEFGRYWQKAKTYYVYKGSYITSNPSTIFGLDITKGDVIQYASPNILGRSWICRSYNVCYWIWII